MKRILLSLGILSAFAIQASAQSLNLTITNPQSEDFGQIQYGQSYNLYGTITGVNFDVSSFTFTNQSGVVAPNGFTFTPSTALTNYIALTTTANFGTVGAAGYDAVNGNGGGLLGSIRLISAPNTGAAVMGTTYKNILRVDDTTSNDFDTENLRATAATPEPASLAALGVGAVALLRRRRKA